MLEELKGMEFREPPGCRCGEVLRGVIHPADCPLFGGKCRPSHPVGPCMVSGEGACNIEYRYKND
jgi:hydrogenase expression/formation protein HypD